MKKLIITIPLLASSFLCQSQALPALPNTSSIITCFPDTTGYAVITVGPVNRDFTDLQLAINSVSLKTVLVLDAGATFNGSFSLPNKTTGTGWIIITSSRMDLLPDQNTRIQPNAVTGNTSFPTQEDAMPKIVTTNTSGVPCFYTNASAHHYRFVGLEITISTSVTNSYGLVQLGDASSAQNVLSVVPQQLIVDRCYIHGHTNATIMKVGVLLNSANTAVINSHISDFHSIGFDAQAIGGTNGPGPFKIINNYLEGSGENIMFGGGVSAIVNLVPSDIEVLDNYFFKPYTWRVGHTSYAGNHWTIKNLFELKNAQRVLLDGNIMENSWADLPTGQSGYAILLTVRGENGNMPWAAVQDITITNNIIRHVGAGISLAGHDDQGASQLTKRIKIANNLFEDINGPAYGDGNIYGPNDGILIKFSDPSDVIIDHNTVFQTGAITWAGDTMANIRFTNNLMNCFMSSGNYQGMYGPGFGQGGNGPMGCYLPGITDANQLFHKNVMIGGNASNYTNYSTLSTNYFPASQTNVSFVNYANGPVDYHNYALTLTSPYHSQATDGTDIGVNFVILDTGLSLGSGCVVVTGIDQNSAKQDDISIYPNPATGIIFVKAENANEEWNFLVYDAVGKLVYNKNFQGNSQVDLSNLQKGIYIANLISEKRSATYRIILVD